MAAAVNRSPRDTRSRWFVTAHSVGVEPVGDRTVVRPASTLHAKTMGTTTTACGLPCGTWTKVFDVAFPVPGGGECCRACTDVVARTLLHERTSRPRVERSPGRPASSVAGHAMSPRGWRP